MHREGVQPQPQVPVQVRGRKTAAEAQEAERKRQSDLAAPAPPAVSGSAGFRDVTSSPVAVSGDLRPRGGLAPEAAGVLQVASLPMDLGPTRCVSPLWFSSTAGQLLAGALSHDTEVRKAQPHPLVTYP